MPDKFAISFIGPEFDNINFVDRILTFPEPVPLFNPAFGSQLHTKADNSNISLLIGSGFEFPFNFFQIKRIQWVSKGNNFYKLFSQNTLEE